MDVVTKAFQGTPFQNSPEVMKIRPYVETSSDFGLKIMSCKMAIQTQSAVAYLLVYSRTDDLLSSLYTRFCARTDMMSSHHYTRYRAGVDTPHVVIYVAQRY